MPASTLGNHRHPVNDAGCTNNASSNATANSSIFVTTAHYVATTYTTAVLAEQLELAKQRFAGRGLINEFDSLIRVRWQGVLWPPQIWNSWRLFVWLRH